MKKFLKQKFSKRLLSLLNFRRNGILRSAKRVASLRDEATSSFHSLVRPLNKSGDFQDKSFLTSLARLNQQNVGTYESSPFSGHTLNEPLRFGPNVHSLSAPELISSVFSIPQKRIEIGLLKNSISDKLQSKVNGNQIVATLKKKKFALRSFLYSAVCKFPRKYVFDVSGEERTRKYYTIPYRLSFSGFVCDKALKGYYSNLSHKVLFALHKKIKIRAKKSDKLAENFNLKSGLSSRLLTLPQQKKEITKHLVLNLENRLDSSVLRLLQFKSLYTIKLSKFRNADNSVDTSAKRLNPKLSNYKVKSPWKNFSALHVKQQINHGHVYINGKKNKCASSKLKLTDQIALSTKGFFPSILKEPTSACKHLFLQAGSSSGNALWHVPGLNFDSQSTSAEKLDFLSQCIKNWKVKRFTEIFYLTYKNYHLLPDNTSVGLVGINLQQDKASGTTSNETWQENHLSLKPLFQRIGYNQSIFFLWPLASLLTVEAWKPEIKRLILGSPSWLSRQSRRDSDKIKRSLRDLLVFKKSTNVLGNVIDNEKTNLSRHSILEHFMQICTRNPSWLHSTRFNNYASIVYGTRKCKWVQFQQGKKNDFYRKVYDKLQFLELELDFFQHTYRYYRA